MSRLHKTLLVGLAALGLLTACGNDDKPAAEPTPTDTYTTPAVSPTPTPLASTPTQATSTPSETVQTNAWGDDPVEAVETKIISADGYKADLNIAVAHPLVHTSLDALDELDPTGELQHCLEGAALDNDREISLVTARVVIELIPEKGGRFTWPDDLSVPIKMITQKTGTFDTGWTPCRGSNGDGTTVSPTQPTQSWFVMAMNVTPKEPGWKKPYPWSHIHIEVYDDRYFSYCKVSRKTKGFVIDTRYAPDEGCWLDLTPKP